MNMPIRPTLKPKNPVADLGLPFGTLPQEDPLQNRAIGVVKGRLTLDPENRKVGKLTVAEGIDLPCLIQRESVAVVMRKLDLTQEHHFKVYPKMRKAKKRPLGKELCFSVIGVRTPDQHTNLEEQDQIFSIAGSVEKVFQQTRKDKKTGEETSQTWIQVRIQQKSDGEPRSFSLLIQAKSDKITDALEFRHCHLTCRLAGPNLRLRRIDPIARITPPVIFKPKKQKPQTDGK